MNHAVWGGIRRAGLGGAVVTTAVEHSSVLDACRREAGPVVVIGVDGQGRFDPDEVIAAITDDTALVTVQLANHEVGTLQPVAAICSAARARDVLVHVDACTAAGHVPVDFGELGADLLSVTAHKLGGPKGVGALLVRRGLRIPPLIIGGAQERERRGGLENVPAIVGFGAAATELAGDGLAREAEVTRRITETVAAGALDRIDGVVRYGDPGDAGAARAVPRDRGRRGRADPPRTRPAGCRGAFGVGVLERGAGTVTGARGDGRGRGPVAARQRGLVVDRRRRHARPGRAPGYRPGPPRPAAPADPQETTHLPRKAAPP